MRKIIGLMLVVLLSVVGLAFAETSTTSGPTWDSQGIEDEVSGEEVNEFLNETGLLNHTHNYWTIIDKVFVPPSLINRERWYYIIENEDGERIEFRSFDGTFIKGDKVEVIKKKQGIITYYEFQLKESKEIKKGGEKK